MNTLEAIEQRRSIRKFKSDPIPAETLEKILLAATLAPSGKNQQPWRFVVVQENRRAEMVCSMREGMARLQGFGVNTGSAKWTAAVMEQAPVTVLIFNPNGKHPDQPYTMDDVFSDLVNVQSVGAAIQNMCLAAADLGLGSLWICDVFFSYPELCQFAGEDCQMVAALSLGYPDESPAARPRKPLSEVVRWL